MVVPKMDESVWLVCLAVTSIVYSVNLGLHALEIYAFWVMIILSYFVPGPCPRVCRLRTLHWWVYQYIPFATMSTHYDKRRMLCSPIPPVPLNNQAAHSQHVNDKGLSKLTWPRPDIWIHTDPPRDLGRLMPITRWIYSLGQIQLHQSSRIVG